MFGVRGGSGEEDVSLLRLLSDAPTSSNKQKYTWGYQKKRVRHRSLTWNRRILFYLKFEAVCIIQGRVFVPYEIIR